MRVNTTFAAPNNFQVHLALKLEFRTGKKEEEEEELPHKLRSHEDGGPRASVDQVEPRRFSFVYSLGGHAFACVNIMKHILI